MKGCCANFEKIIGPQMALSDPPASRKDTVAEKATYFFFGKNDEDEHVVVQGKHSSDQIEQLVRRSQTLTEKGL